MLLRVDKVSGGNSPSDPRPSEGGDPPLHACLATAPGGGGSSGIGGDASATQGGSQVIGGVAHDVVPASPHETGVDCSGEILTVGRKNCMVTVDDKCVSRTHATIALLSNKTVDDESAALARELLDRLGGPMMEFGAPSTPDEISACESSPTGVICVVRDRGSKFGTYVSVDEGLAEEYQNNDNGNNDKGGDETGDETDDEGGANGVDYVELTDKQARAVRLLSDANANDGSNAGDGSGMPKFRKLDANQSLPLLQLSHSKSTSPHVIILFGPQGSAVRLSLLPLQFTFSRIKKPELDPLLSSLHYVGGTHSAQWDVQKSTHLVAPDKTAAAKGIMAWACRRPVVTTEYIEALLKRRDAGAPLPSEEDHGAKGSWDAKLKYTPEPSAALKGYRVAVMVDDDNAPLVQSAGADVLLLHEDAPASQGEFEAWWADQKRRAADDRVTLVAVGSTKKECKHLAAWLKHDGEVRFTNAKIIAKAITGNGGEGELLLDTKKVVIEKIEGWDAVKDDKRGEEEEKEEEGSKKMAAADPSAGPGDAARGSEKETDRKTTEEEDENFEANGDHFEEEEMPVSTRRKRRQEEEEAKGEAAEEPEAEQPPKRQKRGRANKEKEKEVPPPEEDEAPVEEERPKPRRKRKPAEDEDEAAEAPAEEAQAEDEPAAKPAKRQKKKKVVVDESSDDEPGLPEERIALPVTDDGWLVAAPRRRKAYRKEMNGEDNEMIDGERIVDFAAETEKVSGLVVRKYVKPDKRCGAGGRSVGRASGRKKDFKRFRKNNVIRGYTTFDPNDPHGKGRAGAHGGALPRIRLVERLPKESERQRQLQQQQEDLEHQEELADRLFNDAAPGTAKGGRKRKTKNNSLDAFLTQTTTKRGRGRR